MCAFLTIVNTPCFFASRSFSASSWPLFMMLPFSISLAISANMVSVLFSLRIDSIKFINPGIEIKSMLSPFETDLIVKLLISAMLGGLIGLEREVHKKPGGLRMHALVCLGSTLFTISSVYFNVAHIAAGIVGGIGFLGAG